jgi:WD40 repeat protein
MVVFSKNGKTMVSAYGENVKLWEAPSGHFLRELSGHRHKCPINTIAFSKDKKFLASASDDGFIQLWDPATWQCLHALGGRTGRVGTVAISHNGLLASTSGNTVQLWDLTEPTNQQRSATGDVDSVSSLVFSKDGKTLACAYSRDVQLWDDVSG